VGLPLRHIASGRRLDTLPVAMEPRRGENVLDQEFPALTST
jgi:hypothetical protein